MYHLHVRWVRRIRPDTAIRCQEYITRTGRYAKRPDKVRQTFSGCMPLWSREPDAVAYWKAADSLKNRINARILYTIECALPEALTADQQNQLAVDFMGEVSRLWAAPGMLGLPYTVAVHEGHGTNPHFHALLSTSLNDGIVRSAAQWFRRAHPSNPVAGGARRSRRLGTYSWLLEVRRIWAVAANKALEFAKLKPALDHRSHVDRDIDRAPDIHVGPSRLNHPRDGQALWSKFRRQTLSRIEEFYAWRRSKALRKEAESTEQLADQENKKRRAIQKTMSFLLRELQQYREEEIIAAATCALSAENPGFFPSSEALAELEGSDGKIMQELGADWLLLRSGPYLWVWHPSKTDFIVIGGEFLATDSKAIEIIDAFAKIAGLLKVPFSHGEVVGTMRSSVESRLKAQRIAVQWYERDVDTGAAPVRARSLRP